MTVQGFNFTLRGGGVKDGRQVPVLIKEVDLDSAVGLSAHTACRTLYSNTTYAHGTSTG